MLTKLVTLFAVVAIGLTVTAHAAVDITGTWTARFDTPIGEQNYTYVFVVKGTELTGKATGGMGESAISAGKVDGDTVTFVEMLDGQIRVEYTGRITSADEIQFSRKVGEYGVEELVVKRAVSK